MADRDLNDYLSLPYRIVIEPDLNNGGMTIYIPDLPGCITQGDNLEDAYKMIEDAKRVWIESALEDGVVIPEPTNEEEFSGKFVVKPQLAIFGFAFVIDFKIEDLPEFVKPTRTA